MSSDLSDRNSDHNHCNRARNAEKYCHTAMSASIYETVRSAFEKNYWLCLENTKVDFTKSLKLGRNFVNELLSSRNKMNLSLARNIGAESSL